MGVNHFALAMFISDSFFIREHIRNAWKTGSRSGRGYGQPLHTIRAGGAGNTGVVVTRQQVLNPSEIHCATAHKGTQRENAQFPLYLAVVLQSQT